MAGNEPFRFKQFSLLHQRSAMKVGTDGVLLGAWARVQGGEEVLDIGTGTGLIALMMAQRMSGKGKVVGVELDPESVAEACENIENSPWRHMVSVVQSDFVDWKPPHAKFDRIVSNPPFFQAGHLSPKPARGAARHSTAHLSHGLLLQLAEKYLAPQGTVSLILPSAEGRKAVGEALLHGLFLSRECRVVPREGKPVERLLLEFSKNASEPAITYLTLQGPDGQFTEEFKRLTRDFYLRH
jgi:tRNA1Val (adenine37-N6)-methyltransferase